MEQFKCIVIADVLYIQFIFYQRKEDTLILKFEDLHILFKLKFLR